LEIVLALTATGGLAGRLHGGQQQCDEHADDRDDHEQFDERKPVSCLASTHDYFSNFVNKTLNLQAASSASSHFQSQLAWPAKRISEQTLKNPDSSGSCKIN